MDTSNTNSKTNLKDPGTLTVPFVQNDQIPLSQLEIRSLLQEINSDLAKVSKESVMEDPEIESYTVMLFRLFFTRQQANAARMFIVWGKKNDFRSKKVLPNYFFPTPEDMQQFNQSYVDIQTHEARLKEQKRVHDEAMYKLVKSYKLLRKTYNQALEQNHRLLGTPAAPIEIPFDTKELIQATREKLNHDPNSYKTRYESEKERCKRLEAANTKLSESAGKYVMENIEKTKQLLYWKQKYMEFDSTISLSGEEITFMKDHKMISPPTAHIRNGEKNPKIHGMDEVWEVSEEFIG